MCFHVLPKSSLEKHSIKSEVKINSPTIMADVNIATDSRLSGRQEESRDSIRDRVSKTYPFRVSPLFADKSMAWTPSHPSYYFCLQREGRIYIDIVHSMSHVESMKSILPC